MLQQRVGEASCSGRHLQGPEFATLRTGCSGNRGAFLQRPVMHLRIAGAGDLAASARQRQAAKSAAAVSFTEAPAPQDQAVLQPNQQNEAPSIREFLRGRHVLVTGATGFLAKVMIEKILWEQPDVEQLYLLIQPRGEQTAGERLTEQVIPSEAFSRLREHHGNDYERFMTSKLTAVQGRLGVPHLGIADEERERLQQVVDVVVNSAATTTFDERFDQAVAVNTLGAQEVARFAAGCGRLQTLVHVSTAFVNGLRQGATSEMPFVAGDCIAAELGVAPGEPLNVQNEVELARRLASGEMDSELGIEPGTPGDDASREEAYKALGMRRAQQFGWQDTYVFSKAMGEMLLGQVAKEHGLPVAVVRPSIVESAWREPMRGWMEGIRMADPIILAYGKGSMEGFVGDRHGVLDIVPVDTVINATLAAAAFHARAPGLKVYHVATSVANPLGIEQFTHIVSEAFKRDPMLDRSGSPVKVGQMEIYSSESSFVFDMWRRYQLPMDMTEFKHKMMPWTATRESSSSLRKQKFVARKTFEQLSYLAQIYKPYTFYKCRFGCDNVLDMSSRVLPEEQEAFNFDVRSVDWAEYLRDVHIPGLRRFVLKGRS